MQSNRSWPREELRRGESKGDGDQDEEADKPEDAWSERSVKSGVVKSDHHRLAPAVRDILANSRFDSEIANRMMAPITILKA